MRKITNEIVLAFNNNETLKRSNTETNGTAIWLHGNKIAEKRDGSLWISNAGWFTKTTKERLNALYGVSIQQKKGQWFLNSKPWSGEWVNTSDWTAKI